MSRLARPPIESLRPVVSFAAVRLMLPVAGLLGAAILGFPYGTKLATVLAAVAIPWALVVLMIARANPTAALSWAIAAGDLAMLAAVESAVPETYAAVHFVALVFIAAHAHFQGERRGIVIAGGGAAVLIAVAAIREGPVTGDLLAFYETLFAVAALGTAAVVGELRSAETAGRLRARELSRRTIAGEDEVRRQVADFIHDGPVQELIGLDLLLRGASNAADRGDTSRATELIANARALAESNIRALRDEIVNLGPYAFEELSFEIAVERCIPVWRRRFDCDVSVDANVDLDPDVANDLFRITQEAVANACKHGEARQVQVTLTELNGMVELRVRDDGKGFGDTDPLAPHEPGHIGLASMRERSAMLDGRLELKNVDGGGALVSVMLPRPSARRQR